MPTLYPAIMSGGSGTRLWPLSRANNPKQFHRLTGTSTMLGETIDRLVGVDGSITFTAPTVICGAAHRPAVLEILHAHGQKDSQLIIEPVGRNTAPVAIAASLAAQDRDPDAFVLLLPADHHIADNAAFHAAIEKGVALAASGRLVTFAIRPDRPETGYGYLKRGEALGTDGFLVDAFVEKPNQATAAEYLAAGDYAWNAGIFLFRAADLLAEAKRLVPTMLDHVVTAYGDADRQGHEVWLAPRPFHEIDGDSLDYAIMERTQNVAMVGPVEMGWNDIGSWQAVRDLMSDTLSGNQDDPSVIALNCTNTLLRSEGPLVAAIGLDDIVVVATEDAVLVTRADASQDVKDIISQLKSRGCDDLL